MKILIVDDHSYNRDLLRFVLEDEGYGCVEAENGLLAIERFREEPDIELILMDVNMPLMDGIDATKNICSIRGDRYVTIIFVTALDNPDVLVQCLDAGGDDFVPKPINESVLLSKVKAHSRNQETYNRLLQAHEQLERYRQSVEREHSIVEHVFTNGLERIKTRSDNLVSYTSSMSMFNGDLVLSAPSPSGGQYILVGDFTGHGLSAAVGSLPVMSIFYGFVAKQSSVSELAIEINHQLHNLLPLGMFFCASILHLDKDGSNLTMWSGGMNDTLVVDPIGNHVKCIRGDHMPLGILSEQEFDESMQIHQFSQGTRLYIYTDGVNEAKNSAGEEYGEERIIELLKSKVDNAIPSLIQSVKQYRGVDNQDDDISIVELICKPCVHRDKASGDIVDVSADYHAAECFPWRLHMNLKGDDLKRADIVNQVVSFLSTIQGVELHQDKLFTITSELFNNALEHGVLRLQSNLKDTPDGFEQYYQLRQSRLDALVHDNIEIELEYLRGNPNQIRLVITDSGDGFDFESKTEQANDSNQSHGRGLQLLYSLCSSLVYSNGGKTVTACYDFS